MSNWTPVFDELPESSLWQEPLHVRVAFLTILAKKNHRTQIVRMDVGRLSRVANITPDQAEDAYRVLSSPDPGSMSQEHEGRRIIPVAGGWYVVNGQTYKDRMMKEVSRESNAERQARFREKQRASNGSNDTETAVLKGRLGALFKRPADAEWSQGEEKAIAELGRVSEDDLVKLERYYRGKFPESMTDIRRKTLLTLLTNFSGEMDKARKWREPSPV